MRCPAPRARFAPVSPRGLKLNYTEATALIATVVLELIRDGKTCSELMSEGRKLLGKNQVPVPASDAHVASRRCDSDRVLECVLVCARSSHRATANMLLEEAGCERPARTQGGGVWCR